MKFNPDDWMGADEWDDSSSPAREEIWTRSSLTTYGDRSRRGTWHFYRSHHTPILLTMAGTWREAYDRAVMHLQSYPGDYILSFRPQDAKSS